MWTAPNISLLAFVIFVLAAMICAMVMLFTGTRNSVSKLFWDLMMFSGGIALVSFGIAVWNG